ncbi:Major sperm protein (MSP) domain [Trypanosoma melophagium]|uniref:Major sperm protein (MSP) domain n=1 Tax=Trypanosoma melophagium TaxID=715481 RepID=UPI00351A565C|nr:Major sperm protein (MSP) domain [Trypanosoma melophagium]
MLAADSVRDKETESVNGVNDPTSTAAVIVTPEKFRIISHTKEECVLQVSNVSFENILFRLLTTCPERYLVKPTKGVIKPNASITATIVLNPTALANETDLDVKHDDFRLEYCVMRPNDVIGPRCVNVPNIIKARKQEDRRLVYKKLLRCTLELTSGAAGKKGSVDRAGSHPSNTSTTNTTGGIAADKSMGAAEYRDSRGSRDGSLAATHTTTDTGYMTALSSSAGGLSTKTDLRELEQNTLAAKNRRQMAQQQHQKTKMKAVVYAVSALVALIAAWLMYGWM